MPNWRKELRAFNKVAMVAHKGGLCSNPKCRKPASPANTETFEFDHIRQLNDATNCDDRFGSVRDWVTFTPKWFAWAATVELFCAECHRKRHHPKQEQLEIDWDVQARIDAARPVDNIVPIKKKAAE